MIIPEELDRPVLYVKPLKFKLCRKKLSNKLTRSCRPLDQEQLRWYSIIQD